MSRYLIRCLATLASATALAACWLGLSAFAAETTTVVVVSEETVAVATLTSGAPSALRVPVDSAAAAKQLDTLLAQEWKVADAASTAAASASDEVFVRRASFDLMGELPTPEEITLFLLDSSTDKRAKLIERLVADQRFGLNWGRYWRDVILARRSDERALFAAESVTR
jgi:hypothetical protein